MIVGIYQRVSTQEQVDGYSISEQQERLTNYCKALNWDIFKSYTDPGYTGANMDRPGLQMLINDAKSHKIEKVVVYKLDRLSRSQLDTLYLIEKVFLANGVDFVSVCESFDTSTPFGRAMIGVLAVFAQLEREQIKERMLMGKEARAKEGKYNGSWVTPIGYDYINGELLTNDFEKAQVLKVFEMFFNGVPIKRMIKELKESGYYHKHGYWNDRTIRNVLRSKTYLGYIRYHDQWFKGAHEAFITEEQHQKAVTILDQRKADYEAHKRPGKAQSYLGGLLVCAHCGAKYSKKAGYKRKDGTQLLYYACNSRLRLDKLTKDKNCKNKFWNMDELDGIVFDEIRKLAVDPDAFEDMRESVQPDFSGEIQKIEKQIERLIELYSASDMPLTEIQNKIKALTAKKETLEKSAADAAAKTETASHSIEVAKTFGAVLDNGDFTQIRTVLTALIDFIEIDNDDLTIHWRFS